MLEHDKPASSQPAEDTHRISLSKSLRLPGATFLVIGIIELMVFLLSEGSLEARTEALLMAVLFIALGLLLLIQPYSERWLSFMRLRGWTGDVKAEVVGFNIYSAVLLPLLVPVVVALVMLVFPTAREEWLPTIIIAAGIGVLFIALTALGSKVTLESGGICAGPKYTNRAYIPFDKTASVTLSGRTLKIELQERIPLGSKTFRFYLLGDISGFSSALDKTRTTAMLKPSQSVAPSSLPPVPALLHTGGSSTPAVIGVLLIISGMFAILTGILFFYWMDLLGMTDPRPGFLECCAWLEYIFGAIAILAGASSITRRHYGLVRIGSVVSIISVGGGVSLILGIIALIMVLKAGDEYLD